MYLWSVTFKGYASIIEAWCVGDNCANKSVHAFEGNLVVVVNHNIAVDLELDKARCT
jgi:hypothetical protein